jgi:hypothetical protein
MKYAFIERHRRVWPIRVQCRVLGVSVSGYHQHLARRREIAQRRHLSDEALLVHIRAVFAENRGAYGWPRIWRELREQAARTTADAAAGHSCPRQAVLPGQDNRQPARAADRAQPVEPQLRCVCAQPGVGW